MTDARRPRIDLEKSLAELEEIVAQLEAGDLPLEKSLKQFERGVRLSRDCQSALQDAEQRVQALMGPELQELDPETLDRRNEATDDD
ncbi:MAG: exodeoxyribonuclease VII small subunit [Gammaproteobacteria bacterium]|jgi:exodeoxyribonuclease VII small subunit|nr:exodeoxyribonuclease VII small subunit [Gammaproteobacteria bacterium]